MIFKPKHKRVLVPGFGVIEQADFQKEHFEACIKQVKAAKLDVDEYIKKRFDVVSYGDMPLFTDSEAIAKAEQERIVSEEAELQRQIEAEEADRKAAEEAELLKQIEAEEEAKTEPTQE